MKFIRIIVLLVFLLLMLTACVSRDSLNIVTTELKNNSVILTDWEHIYTEEIYDALFGYISAYAVTYRTPDEDLVTITVRSQTTDVDEKSYYPISVMTHTERTEVTETVTENSVTRIHYASTDASEETLYRLYIDSNRGRTTYTLQEQSEGIVNWILNELLED